MRDSHHREPQQAGFTVLEILVTLAVIAILATVAVPNYLSSRAAANESAAIATLRSISTAQTSYRNSTLLDRDGDGMGEHGTIGELTGSVAVPSTGELLSPRMLPPSLAQLDAAGRTSKAGYWFALYLPDANGLGLAENATDRNTVDPDLAETHWTCLAWPLRHGASGVQTYFVSEQGEVRKNRTARYSGTNRIPPAGAALVGSTSADHIVGSGIATGTVGADGEIWMAVQ